MSFSNASGVGYLFRVIASSWASVYGPRSRNPGYQTSNGSSGRPRRSFTSAPTSAKTGEERTASSIALTRASGICRSSSKRRAMRDGAAGEYGSTRRAARKVARSFA